MTEKKHETTPEFIASISSVLVVGLFIITFCVQAFEIPSGSMEDTLLVGDHVFVDRVLEAPHANWMVPIIPYRHPKDGDIIVFLSPSEPGLYLVKRVIGVPGDHIHLRDGVVYRNNQPLDEPYVIRDGSYDAYRDNFPLVATRAGSGITMRWRLAMSSFIADGNLVVPQGQYFVMGDNRDDSLDSRYWGFAPQENIIGSPRFIYWSFETSPNQYLKTSLGDRSAFLGKVLFHFFDETRWRRMFRSVR
jgi:signal peptidase I